MPSFQKSLIVEQFQGNYLKAIALNNNSIKVFWLGLRVQIHSRWGILSKQGQSLILLQLLLLLLVLLLLLLLQLLLIIIIILGTL